jgi:cobalt/nickel transport system permease protein
VKVVVTVLFIVSNLLIPDGAWLGFALALGMVVVSSALSGLGWDFSLKRSFVALPFALAALTVLFSIPGPALVSFSLGSGRYTITEPGVLRFISILARSWISVQMAILLVATTQFPDLIHALRHLRFPAILTAVISFMYRYLFVLSDEVMRLLRARQARSARLPGTEGSPPVGFQAHVAGNLAGQLFLRSYERSDRIYNAMLARGYTGQLLTLNPHVMKRRDWIAVGVALMAMVLVQVVARV